MDVLAVQRGDRWIYRPRGDLTLRTGDRVVAVGPEDGASELEDLCAAPSPETKER